MVFGRKPRNDQHGMSPTQGRPMDFMGDDMMSGMPVGDTPLPEMPPDITDAPLMPDPPKIKVLTPNIDADPINYGNPLDDMYGPPQGVNPNSWMDVVDQDDYVQRLSHILSGEQFDGATKQWVRYEHAKELINRKGINTITTLLNSILSKNTIMNNLDILEVRKLLKQINYRIVFLLRYYYADFSIDKRNLGLIRDLVDVTAQLALMRSYNGVTLDFLKGTQRWNTTLGQNVQYGQQGNAQPSWGWGR